MEDKLLGYMQWPEIEAIIYSEHDRPKQILGPHKVDEGVLVQAYFPGAEKCEILVKGQEAVEMREVDEDYFAVLLSEETIPVYHYRVTYGEDHTVKCRDPYAFPATIQIEDIKKFQAGIHYEVYKVLGAHPMMVQGVKGVRFAVWAPKAIRVSVVGDFNQWDGRRHPMQRRDGDIHELFIPGLKEG